MGYIEYHPIIFYALLLLNHYSSIKIAWIIMLWAEIVRSKLMKTNVDELQNFKETLFTVFFSEDTMTTTITTTPFV